MFDRTKVNGPMQVQLNDVLANGRALGEVDGRKTHNIEVLFLQAYLRHQVEGLYNNFRNYTDNSEVPEDHILQ